MHATDAARRTSQLKGWGLYALAGALLAIVLVLFASMLETGSQGERLLAPGQGAWAYFYIVGGSLAAIWLYKLVTPAKTSLLYHCARIGEWLLCAFILQLFLGHFCFHFSFLGFVFYWLVAGGVCYWQVSSSSTYPGDVARIHTAARLHEPGATHAFAAPFSGLGVAVAERAKWAKYARHELQSGLPRGVRLYLERAMLRALMVSIWRDNKLAMPSGLALHELLHLARAARDIAGEPQTEETFAVYRAVLAALVEHWHPKS